MSARPDLAGVLAEHRLAGTVYLRDKHAEADVCRCGTRHPQYDDGRWPTHRAHVAAALNAAIDAWLADADPWDLFPAALTTPTTTEPEEGKR